MNMENIIVTIVNALGTLGEKYTHIMLDALEAFVVKSSTPVDNAVFYKVIGYIQSWKPKNPTE